MLSSLRSAALAALVAAPLMTLSLVPAVAQAKGDAAAGEGKAAACLACHGVNGNSSNPEWPSLAGQNAAYISEQLKMFRDGKRLEADPSYYAAGEALYRGGDRKRNIPSCKACHGPVGKGNPGSGYPAVRAQHSVYTIAQLQAYASEQRYVDAEGNKQRSRNGHMMVTISKRLTEEDKRNLASYIQGMR